MKDMDRDVNGNEIINWNGCRITVMKVTYAPRKEPIILVNPKDSIVNDIMRFKDHREMSRENSQLNHLNNNLEYEFRKIKRLSLLGIIKWWLKNRKK